MALVWHAGPFWDWQFYPGGQGVGRHGAGGQEPLQFGPGFSFWGNAMLVFFAVGVV
jgi:hypothetical protein